jgi:hypothetical protein
MASVCLPGCSAARSLPRTPTCFTCHPLTTHHQPTTVGARPPARPPPPHLVVHHLPHARLDQQLGALVAGEHGDVHALGRRGGAGCAGVGRMGRRAGRARQGERGGAGSRPGGARARARRMEGGARLAPAAEAAGVPEGARAPRRRQTPGSCSAARWPPHAPPAAGFGRGPGRGRRQGRITRRRRRRRGATARARRGSRCAGQPGAQRLGALNEAEPRCSQATRGPLQHPRMGRPRGPDTSLHKGIWCPTRCRCGSSWPRAAPRQGSREGSRCSRWKE